MDLTKVLQQLHEELENLDAAILSLERLEEYDKKRGRPPNWLAEVKKRAPAPRKRKFARKSAKPGASVPDEAILP
jgi:hypothetical protein